MPRYALYDYQRRLCHVSRAKTIEAAVQEWIETEFKPKYGKLVRIERIWTNAVPANSGGVAIYVDHTTRFPYEWRITEDNMKLTTEQSCKPIDCYVVMLDFFSKVDNRKIASEPVGVWFEHQLAQGFINSAKLESYEKLRVVKVTTTGVTGLQAVIDKIFEMNRNG